MKTREHYEKLLTDYVAIIPKNAPAYELLEAIQDLINILETSRNVYHYHNHILELPEGWSIEDKGRHGYVMYDDKGLLWGISSTAYVGANVDPHYTAVHKSTSGEDNDVRYLARTQLEALQYLCKEAFKNN